MDIKLGVRVQQVAISSSKARLLALPQMHLDTKVRQTSGTVHLLVAINSQATTVAEFNFDLFLFFSKVAVAEDV